MKTLFIITLLPIVALHADTITNITAIESIVHTQRVERVRVVGTNRVAHVPGQPMRPFTLVTNQVTLRTLRFEWAGKTRTITEPVK